MKDYLTLLRPHQYVKNLFIFLPAFFALRITEPDLIIRTAIVFVAFCFVASAVYILNDYMDIEDDRKHPEKKNRPLASGKVAPKTAWIIMAGLLTVSAFLFALVDLSALALAGGYFVMNVLYSLKLKHVPVVDIFVIATGFVIRLFIGSFVGDIALSMWIILVTFLLALFLALAKRRTDVVLASEGNKVRKAIDGYNLEFINGAMMIMASVLVVSYISYTISPAIQEKFQNENLYLTVFFVLLGLLRYMQITFVEGKSGSPTKVLLRDIYLQLILVGWLVAFVILIY